MPRKRQSVAPLTLVLLTIVCGSALACGGTGKENVDVVLREWRISASKEEARNGHLRLAVTNQGSMEHQLVVVKSDLRPDDLPLVEGKVDETKVNVQAKLDLIPAGATAGLEADLSPGKYVLMCNLVSAGAQPSPSHYANGMYASFFVRP